MGRKWNNIKDTKAAKDADKSKLYAKFGKEIYVIAKPDHNLESNRNLKAVLDKAKTYKIPRDIIDRAINKAKSGVDESYDNIRYEGYGPSGSAIIVDTLTDNVNRTVAEVRAAFNKAHGNLGVSGSVAFMFEPLAVFGIEPMNEEILLEAFIDHEIDVSDIELENDQMMIYGPAGEFHNIQEVLRGLDIEDFIVAEISMMPNDTIELVGDNKVVFEKLLDTLENIDDVQEVYHNVEM